MKNAIFIFIQIDFISFSFFDEPPEKLGEGTLFILDSKMASEVRLEISRVIRMRFLEFLYRTHAIETKG